MKSSLYRVARIAILFPIVFVSAHFYISNRIEAEFTKRNITFQSKERSFLGINYYNLAWNKSIAKRIHIPFRAPIIITVFDAHILLVKNQKSSTSLSNNDFPVQIRAENLSISHSALPIRLEGLSGSVLPKLSLSSSSLKIDKKDNSTIIQGTFPHPMDGADISIKIHQTEEETTFSAIIPTFPFTHSLLSTTSINIPESNAKGVLNGSHLDSSLSFLDSQISAHGKIDITRQKADIEYEASISLDTLHTLFPLSDALSFKGEFLLEGTAQWPEQTWSVNLKSDDFEVTGTIFDPLELKYDSFSHTSPSTLKTHLSGSNTPFWTPFEEIGWLQKTAVAAEDASFWNHQGYSIKSMQEAIDDYQTKQTLRGGSTITQQLAKNLFLSAERTMERKAHELIYTLLLEQSLSKKELLTIYLNIVEFGPEIHGVSRASQLYFLKKPSALSLVEASYLASVLPAPTRFFSLAQEAKHIPRRRTDRVLRNLYDARLISKHEFQNAIATPLRVLPPIE